MKIEQQIIKVREVVDGYVDNGHDGVIGYHGKLDIRANFDLVVRFIDRLAS